MKNYGGALLASAVLLLLAISGTDLYADARMVSGDSVRQNFEVQVQEKENEDRWEDISFPPGFATLNALPNDVQVRCEHSFPEAAPPVLVDAAIHSGESLTSPLYVIDPGNNHVRYECIWAIPFTNQYVSRTAWADANHQNDMNFYCLHCVWKVQDDGVYLFNSDTKAYVKVKDWCTPGSKC